MAQKRRLARRARRAPARKRMVPRRGGRGDAAALRGIKQGTGKSVSRAFGAITSTKYHPCHHDAFHFTHLPLPRAVGPYTVVRTTSYQTVANDLNLFGPFYDRATGKWSDICGLSFLDASKNVGDSGNTFLRRFSVNNASWQAAQAVPSAFSVQVMNPEALQVSKGIVYLGRIRTSLKLSEDLSVKVLDLANLLISYNNPRLCAAAKLAFRGVQVDLVPFNMSELANFTPLDSPAFTQYGASSPDPLGFAPMFIWNPNKISLQCLVCCEWRVRFDPSNPAQATHQIHPPASESVWAQAQHYAEALGNGVVDIADRVANVGNALYGAAGSMYRGVRGIQALRGVGQLALM